MLKPLAQSVVVRFDGRSRCSSSTHEAEGVWAAVRTDATRTTDYRLLVAWADGTEHLHDDPYRFAAHPRRGRPAPGRRGPPRAALERARRARCTQYHGPMGDVRGTSFAVWAPHAQAVRVVGDFNDWDGRVHPMRLARRHRRLGAVRPGRRRRQHATSSSSSAPTAAWRTKADPMARYTEVPARHRDRSSTQSGHEWADDDWMTRARRARPARRADERLRGAPRLLAARACRYRDLADQLIDYVAELGFTHVEFLPVAEHPYGGSWGYQVTGYYAPTAASAPRRLQVPHRPAAPGRHRRDHGLGARRTSRKDELALARFDGEPLYEHPDPRRGEQPDWGTHIFDFGRLEVRNFLVANALYWLRGVPRRRAAGRRRRLDALPRLLAQGRRVDAQRARRPREPRGDRLPPGGQRDRLQARTPAS